MGAVERSRAAKRVRRSEVILRPLAAETFISALNKNLDFNNKELLEELIKTNAQLHQEIERCKHIEAQLRSTEMMLSNAQRIARIGYWEFDMDTQTTYWTDELLKIHGLEPGRSAPNPVENLQLIHPDDLHIHQEYILIPATKGESFEANLRIKRTDHQIRVVNVRGGPVWDDNGNLIKITGTTFDVTEWMLNEKSLTI